MNKPESTGGEARLERTVRRGCELKTKPDEHSISNGYNDDQVRRLMHDARLARMYDKALRKYGQHTYECASHTSAAGKWLSCDCGWEEHPLNDA